MKLARPVPFEYKDYRYGQPRIWNEKTIHTSTELDAAAFDHVAEATFKKGRRIWLVMYDHSPATGLMERIERTLQPYKSTWTTVGEDRGLGPDKLAIVEGLR